jgi:curved DNA-binding protein CbpA
VTRPEHDPYKILQVDHEAEDEVIQAAYRRLAQKYHPDRSPGPDAAARMVAINAAWDILRDPARRAEHDRKRSAPASGAARSPAPSSDPRASDAGASDPAARNTAARDSAARNRAPASPSAASGTTPPPPRPSTSERPPETVSRDWTSGRSGTGSGYDAATMRAPEGLGAAGPPPGNPSGSVLNFGRFAGWSLGEIARADLEYVEWLDRMTIGRPYRDEIDVILRKAGRRRSATPEATERRGLFRRR